MKSIYYLILSILLLMACNGFLEEDDRSLITPDEFFIEARDAQSAVDAIYSHLGPNSFYAKHYWLINALASDIGTTTSSDPDLQEFTNFTISPTNGIVANIWSELYAGIETASFAIENIPRAPISEIEASALIAEARFFRGLFYLDLVRFFGDVPLDTTSNISGLEDFQIAAVSRDSVLSFLVDEFTLASEHLPATADVGRPNSVAALAYLTKVRVLQKEYVQAFIVSRIVLGRQALLPDYASVFQIAQNNNAEVLFGISFNNILTGPMNSSILPESLLGKAIAEPTDYLLNLYERGDRRATVTLGRSNDDDFIAKYWDQTVEPKGGQTANDLPLLRFPDALLTHAEIINEVRRSTNSEAIQNINKVRARARFDGEMEQPVLPDIGLSGYEVSRDAILLERAREFAFEGYRWLDLVRAELLEERVKAVKPDAQVSAKHYRLPIPQVELDKNPLLVQNEGY